MLNGIMDTFARDLGDVYLMTVRYACYKQCHSLWGEASD